MIEIEGITKIYRVEGNTKTVLNKVSLTLPPDKSVALIGRNGAGKSSLLKIISGLSKANEGFIRTSCRISWPIGFAGSFHGELSGAQNARFVARVYGVPSDEVVDYVARFSELGAELYNPVRTYSSGMRARLAFAVSMAIDFDYYLIDEVTSVGDRSFRKKCAETLLQKIGKCGALVVSHNTGMLTKLCTSAVVIEDSKAFYFDAVRPALSFYNWCRDSSDTPDDVGDITDILEKIDDIDPQSKIQEANRDIIRNRDIFRYFFSSKDKEEGDFKRYYDDEIESYLKKYSHSYNSGERYAEILSELAIDRAAWERIFPVTGSDVVLKTLDRFVANEQWKEAESLCFFLFSNRIDGAAASLGSLSRTYTKLRNDAKQRSTWKNGSTKPTINQNPQIQKSGDKVQASPNAGGRWLTLARAAARAHDAGPDAHITLAEALLSVPKPLVDEAQPHIELALDQQPDLERSHLALARLHFHRDHFDEAKIAIERALAINPTCSAALSFREQIEGESAALADKTKSR